MTIENRIAEVRRSFYEFRDLFCKQAYLSTKDIPFKKVKESLPASLYVPDYGIGDDNPRGGIALEDGVGFLTIFENIDAEGKVSAYIYRFSSDEFTYTAEKKSTRERSDNIFFKFHYQNDEVHEPHVSFLHSGIRYLSREIDIRTFLDFIRRTFYIEDGSRNPALPWDSRFQVTASA